MEPEAPSRAVSEGSSSAEHLGASDWARLRARLLHELRREVRVDAQTLEDLAQEACVRLIRVLRQDPRLQPDACVKIIAQRTGADHLRRLYRHRRLVDAAEAGEVESLVPEAADPQKGEMLERLELIVVELFDRAQEQECKALALAWFDGHSWRDVARRQGVDHAAVRKRWSRCVQRARQLLDADPAWGALLRWSAR